MPDTEKLIKEYQKKYAEQLHIGYKEKLESTHLLDLRKEEGKVSRILKMIEENTNMLYRDELLAYYNDILEYIKKEIHAILYVTEGIEEFLKKIRIYKYCVGYYCKKKGEKLPIGKVFTLTFKLNKKTFGTLTFCKDCLLQIPNIGGDLLFQNLAKDRWERWHPDLLKKIEATNSIIFAEDSLLKLVKKIENV